MAKTGQERSAKAALKRIEFDEKELRHRCRLGTRQKLEELMAWSEDTAPSAVALDIDRYAIRQLATSMAAKQLAAHVRWMTFNFSKNARR
ncbi:MULTISPECIES: hypothetical protein [unclassified Pseudomonas]|uniref:hypothetical protein n=1 Tax=unclassified Pseudomonas TaxID=196821 RepID=UPI00200D11B2|nr:MULTISPECIES: hypothetical protein [unclassified Pseudomonas]